MLISRGGYFQRYAVDMVQMGHLCGFQANINLDDLPLDSCMLHICVLKQRITCLILMFL